jgi:DNA repair protein RecO
MRQIRTQAIVLSRTDYGEADRILTFLTEDHGKVRAIAKAVRKSSSKLAGGIELFSVSDICFVDGRGELKTVTSTRLISHYGNIVKEISRTNIAYELIKLLDKVTEDNTEPAYFNRLREALIDLDNADIDPELIRLWFSAQLLKLSGHSPNLATDRTGQKLTADKTYDFDSEAMSFISPTGREGAFSSDHIKFLRLIFDISPKKLQQITGASALATALQPPIRAMLQSQLRV